ncbi:hypothetical protein PM082_015641 [Marasmius tenuissimus]|nr:hypothetical protein PM082_015641 [Marasmius tenuissimus]
MATMVDRPQSILRDSAPMIPQRRSHPEIIDVDSLDDDEVQPTRSVRARREPIEVIDISDDEDADFSTPSSSGSGRAFGRLFSPPPQFNPTPIPPVPPLPPGLAAHASLPMRRHPPPHPSGSTVQPPVRAHDRTFDFETSLAPGPSPRRHSPRSNGSGSSSRQRSNQSSRGSSPPVGVPPRLGLGGALISSNNARLAEERQAASRRRQSIEQRARDAAFRRTMRAVHNSRGLGGFNIGLGPFRSNDRDNDMTHLYLDFGLGGAMTADWPFDVGITRREEVEYKKEYTHPEKPEAGFTFSFSASEDDSQEDGSQFPTTSLDNPIVIDDEDEPTMPSRDKGKGKAVAPAEPSSSLSLKTVLVCSHCRDPLLLGESASKLGSDAAKDRRIWSLRCGHLIDGQCLRTLSAPVVVEPFDPSGKGKGKAPEPQLFEADSEPVGIRSRLRSYGRYIPSFSPFGSPPKKDVIEETHHWECPVASCGRRHTSVKVTGVWGPPKPEMNVGEGVIGVFV